MVSMEALEALLEKLLQDEETKDVDIEMEDGTLRAHACMLCAASDAMRGMLRHGLAADRPRLSWREHPVEVGRFFLRLLYTGTVNEEEWGSGDTECLSEETPLRLLLGGLAIAKMYQVPHLLHALTEALKRRLDDRTFNDVYSGAIKLDVTALRHIVYGMLRNQTPKTLWKVPGSELCSTLQCRMPMCLRALLGE